MLYIYCQYCITTVIYVTEGAYAGGWGFPLSFLFLLTTMLNGQKFGGQFHSIFSCFEKGLSKQQISEMYRLTGLNLNT